MTNLEHKRKLIFSRIALNALKNEAIVMHMDIIYVHVHV